MKYLYLPLIMLVASCGRIDVTGVGGSRVGEAVTSSSKLTPLDRTNLSLVCNAFRSRGVAVGSNLAFKVLETDCTGNTISNNDVLTVVAQSGSVYSLKRKTDGMDFIFPNLESFDSGLLADFCQNSSFDNPDLVGNEVTQITTIGISGDDCQNQAEEICVQVSRASLQNGSYLVHTKEFMRVKVSEFQRPGYVGYFTSRKRVTK